MASGSRNSGHFNCHTKAYFPTFSLSGLLAKKELADY